MTSSDYCLLAILALMLGVLAFMIFDTIRNGL